MSKNVYVFMSCGCCIGPPQWYGTDTFECPECSWEQVVAIPEEEWEDAGGSEFGLGCYCLSCAQLLEDPCHYEVLDEPTTRELADVMSWEDFDDAQEKIHADLRKKGADKATRRTVLLPGMWGQDKAVE
jgi:hypothetical protein